MPKLFGEYLVGLGYIRKEDLLAALMEQQARTPSPAEILYKKKLLNCDDLLATLKLQSTKGGDFLASLQEQQLLTKELAEKISNYRATTRKPIGQILVDRAAFGFDTLTKALADFHAIRAKESGPGVPGATASAKANDDGIKKGTIDKRLLDKLFNILTADHLTCLVQLRKNPFDPYLAMKGKAIFEDLSIGARFAGANALFKLVFGLLGVMDGAGRIDRDLAPLFGEGIDLMLEICDKLKVSASDAIFLEGRDNRYPRILAQLQAHRQGH